MNQGYRLHIDIPISGDLQNAKDITEHIVDFLSRMERIEDVEFFQYKLSHDSDRANKNYLDINENGHCSNKKIKGTFGND